MSLRIIGGEWRSRRLLRPDTSITRPMPDRVKGAIFNILGSFFGAPGGLPPLCVADVFAGSGSMGLEALSRGAAKCTFYETDRTALSALRENIEALDAQLASSVVTGDAWKLAASAARNGSFDLVFLDPPYRSTQTTDPGGQVGKFLRRTAERQSETDPRLVPMVVLHHFEKVRFSRLDAGASWVVWDERKIGSSGVTFFVDRGALEQGRSADDPCDDDHLELDGPYT